MSDTSTGGSRGQPFSSDTGDSAGRDLLAGRLGDLARGLAAEDDGELTLQAIVDAAVATVPGAEHASISSATKRRQVQTVAATSKLAQAVDRAQYATGQGPCLDTLYGQQTVRLADMQAEHRFPAFVEHAARLGVGSMLSVQLYIDGEDLGALNLLSEHPGAFDEQSEHVALLFAAHAAVAMAGAQEQDRLRTALRTRDLIGQAKGILIERLKLNGDQAFAVLVHASQTTNRKLADIAEQLVTSGELPAPAPSPRRPGPGE